MRALIVDDDPLKQGMRFDGFWVVGTSADLSMLIKKHDIGLIIFAVSDRDSEEYTRLSKLSVDLNVRMLLISDMLRALQFWLTNSGHSGKIEEKLKFMVEQE